MLKISKNIDISKIVHRAKSCSLKNTDKMRHFSEKSKKSIDYATIDGYNRV